MIIGLEAFPPHLLGDAPTSCMSPLSYVAFAALHHAVVAVSLAAGSRLHLGRIDGPAPTTPVESFDALDIG